MVLPRLQSVFPGISAVARHFAAKNGFEGTSPVEWMSVVDEFVRTGALLMGQTNPGISVAIIKSFDYSRHEIIALRRLEAFTAGIAMTILSAPELRLVKIPGTFM